MFIWPYGSQYRGCNGHMHSMYNGEMISACTKCSKQDGPGDIQVEGTCTTYGPRLLYTVPLAEPYVLDGSERVSHRLTSLVCPDFSDNRKVRKGIRIAKWEPVCLLASFPGLPRFSSSVCVQYNTLLCIILNAYTSVYYTERKPKN